jgi:hypothetical protein
MELTNAQINGTQKANPVDGDPYSGLTKREHFAAMAMQGLLSNPAEVSVSVIQIFKVLGLPEDTKYLSLEHLPKYLAALSFIHADALLNFLENE